MDRVSLRSIRATLALMVMRSIYQGKCRSVTWVERRETFGAALAWPGAHNGKAFSRRARARVFVHERHDLPPGNKGGAPKATRSPDERQRNPGRAFKLPTRSRISRSLSSGRPLRAGPVGSSGLQIHPATRLQRREAERRQTRISNLRTPTFILAASGRTEEGARRASIGTRSPVGVPPRHLLRRTNATAQLRLRASWDVALTGVTHLQPVPVQRVPRRPVIMPAGRIPEAARGLISSAYFYQLTFYINVLLRETLSRHIVGKYIGSTPYSFGKIQSTFLKRNTTNLWRTIGNC
jgi:hypothetical protein